MKARGAAAILVDGPVRDVDDLVELGEGDLPRLEAGELTLDLLGLRGG